MRGEALQAALGRTLGDPTLVLAYRLPDSRGHADAAGRPVLVPPVTPRPRAARRSSATAARWRRSSTTRRSTTTRRWSRRSAPRRRWRSRTSACWPSPRRGSPRCRRRASASSRPATPSAGGSSATCTTAPSSGWSRIALQLRMIQRRHPRATPRRPSSWRPRRATSSRDSLEELRELARGIHPAALDHGLGAGARVAGDAARRCRPRCRATRREHVPRAGRARRLLRGLRGAGQRRQVRRGDGGVACALSRTGDGRRDRDRRRRRRRRRRRARLGPARPGRPRRGARRAAARHQPARARERWSPRSCRARRDRRRQPARARGHRRAPAARGHRGGGAGGDAPRSCCARSTSTSPTWRSSTSGCRRRTPTRGCARRTRSARGTRGSGS